MPDWTSDIRRHLAGARLPAPDEANVAEELRQHLDDRYLELRAKGASEGDARRGALEELGEHDLLRQSLHAAVRRPPAAVPLGAREGHGLAGIWGDLRFGARMLRRSPGFTVTAALTIALGIGANTTIFSILNAVLLRPLPGAVRADQLVMIGRTQDGQGFDTFSYPDYVDFRADARSLSAIAASFVAPAHLSMGGASERIRAELVSGTYFPMLGTRAAVGRLLGGQDDGAPGANPVVVLSYAGWRSRFGADPGVIGKGVRIDGAPYTIVGVAEPGFNGVRAIGVVDLFIPISMANGLMADVGSLREQRGAVWIDLFGRLAPNATVATAQAELGSIAAELSRRYPDTNTGRGVRVSAGVGFDPGSRAVVRRFLGILVGVVGLVLLIACANVANLLLARGSARAREMAVRSSLGANRSRLVRQLLAEGLLLAVLGSAAGFALGFWSLRFVTRLPLFAYTFGAIELGIDRRVLAFAIAAMTVSGVLFALPPAFRASRVDLIAALKLGTPGGGDNRSRLRSGLVVAQLALSLVLLVAAGLFVRTLQALYRIEPGFETRHVLIATLDAGLQGYDEPRGRRFFSEVEERVRALPGVQQASVAYMVPLGGGGWDTRIYPADVTPAPNDVGLKTDVNAVSPSYFETVGMPVVKGSAFTPADRDGAPAVAVVNEAIAETLWPGKDPIGQRFRIGRDGDNVLEVVGVVRTARYRSLTERPRPFFYRPFAQAYRPSMTLHVRTAAPDPYSVLQSVRRVVDGLDRDIPLSRVQTLAERLDGSLGRERTLAALVGVYGMLALVLAVVGLYGSMAYAVSRRTREMGLRMALGARASEVRRHVLAQALRIALAGTVIGAVAAVPATRLLRSQLFGVEPNDPITLVSVAVVLAAASIAAAYLPARRATKVDPVIALRSD
jgi:predicted permease